MIPRTLLDNYNLLAVRPATTHPDDQYLWVVLRNMANEGQPPRYATHVFNDTLDGGKGGFVSGNYFHEDLDRAFRDFCQRQTSFKQFAVVRRIGGRTVKRRIDGRTCGHYSVSIFPSELAEAGAAVAAARAGFSECDFSELPWNSEGDIEIVIEEVRS